MTNKPSPDINTKDAAWASVLLPMSADTLFEFCLNIERLFRINPYLEFEHWQQLDERRYRFSGLNKSQQAGFHFETTFELKVDESSRQIQLCYDAQSLKASTRIVVESSELPLESNKEIARSGKQELKQGAKLTIVDEYREISDTEKQERLGEVDQSIVSWLGDIQAFLIMWQRWSRFGVWRWYMRRIWQPLKPQGRRIVYMFWWITLVEVALILLGAGIYFVEYT